MSACSQTQAQLNELRVVDPFFSVSPTPSSITRFLWTPHINTYTLSLLSESTESFHFLQYQKLCTVCVLVFRKQKRKREWQKKMLVDEAQSREASQTQPKFRQWIERWQKSTIKILDFTSLLPFIILVCFLWYISLSLSLSIYTCLAVFHSSYIH